MSKQIFIFLLAIIFPAIIYCQGGTTIADKGFGVIAIDKKLSALKTYLITTDKSKFRDTIEAAQIGDDYTSAWTVDLKKAKMETYFGQKVTSVEVYFEEAYDMMTGKDLKEQEVAEFIVYLEAPANETALTKFQSDLMAYYGDVIPATNDDGIMNFTWFSDVTLLQVNFGYDNLGKKSGVYTANFGKSQG